VLVVEDEDAVRTSLRRILVRHGYRVLEARNGVEALRVVAGHLETIDLVLTDVVMPEMNGRAMVEHLRTERPDVAVVYMSAYTDDEALLRGTLEAEASFIQKPFAPAELLRVVRETLDAPARR
jgi:CheY-like chemotaxis protein